MKKRGGEKNTVQEFSVSYSKQLSNDIAKILAKQIDKKIFEEKYVKVKTVLTLVGVGVFLAASLAIPNLPLALKPFLKNEDEYETWKRFNIPYLRRTLARLQKQKLVEISEEEGKQVVAMTETGRRKILKYAVDELTIDKPRFWDGVWRLVSYDIPRRQETTRSVFREYLKVWGFYPFHESVFLHAYPCEKQVEFLREYLGIGEYVRLMQVSKIENDKIFREFFGV